MSDVKPAKKKEWKSELEAGRIRALEARVRKLEAEVARLGRVVKDLCELEAQRP